MNLIKVYRSGIHVGEEMMVTGNHRSGLVTLSGCHLTCNFCYTPETSVTKQGKDLTPTDFSALLCGLQKQGAANLNLISPTHVWAGIEEALNQTPVTLPLVLKTSGYESVNMVSKMAVKADVFVPDFKLWDAAVATRYTLPENYGPVAQRAIAKLLETHGETELDEVGCIKKGILLRHLLMPGHLEDSFAVVNALIEIGYRGVINFMSLFVSNHQLKTTSAKTAEGLCDLARSNGMTVLWNGREARHCDDERNARSVATPVYRYGSSTEARNVG